LTGATGALGAHILDQVLKRRDHSIREVVCLSRATNAAIAYERVEANLLARMLKSVADRNECSVKVTCLAARLGEPHLGLEDATYEALARRVTHIIHAAWAVNFVGGLQSFETDHIRGAHNLIDLAQRGATSAPPPANFWFCSSGATVIAKPPWAPVGERLAAYPESAAPMGYARSKWVAEHICSRAWLSQLRGHVGILRIGQLCGDTQAGIWNEHEGWPLMLRTVDEVGSLPDLQEEVTWLPVDVAASAIVDIVVSDAMAIAMDEDVVPIYHIVNPRSTPWTSILTWIRNYGKHFDVMLPQDWVRKVETSECDVFSNPSRKLLGLWQNLVRLL
jgi:thioester reductase-like protein